MPLDSPKHRIIFQVLTFFMIHFFLFNSPHFFNTKNALSVPGMDPGFVEFVIPSRGISLVRPGEDVIVLPGRSQSLVIYYRNTLHKNAHFLNIFTNLIFQLDFWDYWCSQHGTEPWQAVFTGSPRDGDGLFLEDGFGQEEMADLRKILNRLGADEVQFTSLKRGKLIIEIVLFSEVKTRL